MAACKFYFPSTNPGQGEYQAALYVFYQIKEV